jgi:hypothetical protein
MAVDTKFAKQSFTGLPSWAKGVVAIAAVGGVVYLVYKFQKSGKTILKTPDEKTDQEEAKQQEEELQKELKKKPLTYPLSQYKTFANVIEEATNEEGTDEEAIYAIFRKLKSNADYLALQKAWGNPTRFVTPSWYIFYTTGKRFTIPQLLRNDMSSSEIKKINTILMNNKITYRI